MVVIRKLYLGEKRNWEVGNGNSVFVSYWVRLNWLLFEFVLNLIRFCDNVRGRGDRFIDLDVEDICEYIWCYWIRWEKIYF